MGGHIVASFALNYPQQTASLTLFNAAGVSSPVESELDKIYAATGRSIFEVDNHQQYQTMLQMTMSEQPWVPSPAKTTKRSKSSQSFNKSYPLCLVCDREYGYFEKDGDWCVAGEESSADYLFRKFQKNADR